MDLAVALIIFNRPEKTRQVFGEIARARPSRLFVIADGPRKGYPEDEALCAAARAAVESVDWDCEVHRHYSDVNLGCGKRPASGITWVFEHVGSAVVLEDDCVPHPSFFRYCAELLDRYKDDQRVGQIAGANFQFGRSRTPYSYYFSRFNVCFGGWGTWRRAWARFDHQLRLWPELEAAGWLEDQLAHPQAALHWGGIFERAYEDGGEADYWDHQWTFACWAHSYLTATPDVSLISNIGFGPDATHTKARRSRMANLPLEPMPFPLRHPPNVVRNAEADRFFLDEVILPSVRRGGLYRRIRRGARRWLPAPLCRAVAALGL